MSKKKFTAIYCFSLLVPLLFLLFPLFTLGNRVTPFIFGLPFSFFWVILWVFVAFLIVLFLYRIDPDKDEKEVN